MATSQLSFEVSGPGSALASVAMATECAHDDVVSSNGQTIRNKGFDPENPQKGAAIGG